METQIDITVAGHNYLLHSQNTITLKDSYNQQTYIEDIVLMWIQIHPNSQIGNVRSPIRRISFQIL